MRVWMRPQRRPMPADTVRSNSARYHARVSRSVALIVIVQLVGCSFLTMQKPHGPRERDPDCVVSLAPPIADGLIATLIVTGLVNAELDPQTSRQATVGVDVWAVTSALTFVGSGAYGLHRRSLCRAAYEDHDRYLAETAPPTSSAPRAPTPARSPAARMTGLTVLVVVGGIVFAAAIAAAIASGSS